MANHMSAIRQMRTSLRRNQINRKNKTKLRSQIRSLRTAIQEKDKKSAEKMINQTFSVIDRAVKKGTIKENTGNRYKSRLSRQVAAIKASPAK